MQARKRARRLAVQAIYQWQVSQDGLSRIEAQFDEKEDMARADREYFHELLHKVPAVLDELDAELAPLVERRIDEVDPVERAILRIATYELMRRIDIPYRVVLNEAVALTKTFGASEGHKFVNGVLDRLARKLRAVEVRATGG